MPLYWASDTDGARYCVRGRDMTDALRLYVEHVGGDPEGIDLAADDDVELIGFESPPLLELAHVREELQGLREALVRASAESPPATASEASRTEGIVE